MSNQLPATYLSEGPCSVALLVLEVLQEFVPTMCMKDREIAAFTRGYNAHTISLNSSVGYAPLVPLFQLSCRWSFPWFTLFITIHLFFPPSPFLSAFAPSASPTPLLFLPLLRPVGSLSLSLEDLFTVTMAAHDTPTASSILLLSISATKLFSSSRIAGAWGVHRAFRGEMEGSRGQRLHSTAEDQGLTTDRGCAFDRIITGKYESVVWDRQVGLSNGFMPNSRSSSRISWDHGLLAPGLGSPAAVAPSS